MIKIRKIKLFCSWDHKYRYDIDECIICMQKLNNYKNKIIVGECNHVYHDKCIDNWLKIKDTCPLCHNIWIEKEDRKFYL